MSEQKFEHAVIDWFEDGSDRTPRRAIDAVLLAVKTTPQERDLGIPWRFPRMLAVSRATGFAAVALVAVVGAGALIYLNSPGPGGAGGKATPGPSLAPTSAPTAAAPTARPTLAAYVPPPLSQTFTSHFNGVSLSYPAGWTAKAATTPWRASGGPFSYPDPAADFLFDPIRTDHLFLAVASQPLGATSFDHWSRAILDREGGGSETPIVVDGATGIRSGQLALVATGGRGYVISLATSGDEPALDLFDPSQWFEQILATVQLSPKDAVDTTPAP